MKMIDLNCPKCGATINPDMEKGRCECKYCGHQMLIEKEDTLEEIAAKAQSKAYGFHKGKLQAEAEAGIIREGAVAQKKTMPTLLLIIMVLVIIGVIVATMSHFAKLKVNPFDCIEVSFKGTDGDGEVVLKMVGKGDVDPTRIDYDVSKSSDLSQGDIISILASSSDYRLTEKSKTYIVEGLDEYLTDLADISAEMMELLDKKAADIQEINLSSTKGNGTFVNMKPVKLFLLTDGEQSNQLYVVHEVNFATEEGNKTYYVSTGFEGVVLRSGTQTSADMNYGMYYGNSFTRVDSITYITAYESIESVRTDLLTGQAQDMELTERDVQYTEESTEEEKFSEVVEGEIYTNDEVEDSISIKENEQLQDCLVYGGEYSFDLDGDGTKEGLCLRYDRENGTYCDVEITINGETFIETFGALSTKGYYVTDIDENSPGLEIAIFDFGDSDEPAMHFYTYDGGLNYIGLVYLMNAAQYTLKDNILIGFGGRIEGEISAYVFYTCYATAQWEYSYAEKTINMIEQEMYQMKEDGPYELTEDIKIYKNRSIDSELITLKAQNIYFIESDGESWMKVKGEDGVTGYLHRNEKWEIDSVGKRAEEIIRNLRFAG